MAVYITKCIMFYYLTSWTSVTDRNHLYCYYSMSRWWRRNDDRLCWNWLVLLSRISGRMCRSWKGCRGKDRKHSHNNGLPYFPLSCFAKYLLTCSIWWWIVTGVGVAVHFAANWSPKFLYYVVLLSPDNEQNEPVSLGCGPVQMKFKWLSDFRQCHFERTVG